MASQTHADTIYLDGETLTPETLVALSNGKLKIDLTPEAWNQVQLSRNMIDEIAENDTPVYGINTGFGNFAHVSIPKKTLSDLQKNLIVSHAAGTGAPLSIERTRMLSALRVNVLSKGYSGIKPSTLKTMISMFNNSTLSYVPVKGTVGASGDLAPLSHLALGMLGYGKVWNPKVGAYEDAAKVLKEFGIEPVVLGPKEGLALINGTQFITSLGSEAVVRAENACKAADIITALSLEVLKGTVKPMDPKIHAARPHSGQIEVARRIRSIVLADGAKSELSMSHHDCKKVQDSYTLRCTPQVHGICNDTVAFTKGILTTEINSATDNPMIFHTTKESISGGNFHGEYPAKALDYLAIGIHELSSISERRIERLVNPALSGLPAFLVREGGLHSGFMIAHCTAAALVSENKVLCHPASVDSISTSAAQEDHVSMGGFAARKALEVVENVEKVLAIELLCACQALDLQRPLKTVGVLEKVHAYVRGKEGCGVVAWDEDRYMAPDIEAAWEFIKSGKLVEIGQEAWK
ncbi:aromatic amino acid lyase [Chytriomyces sp. MP71]|nr:aromatic amino acid lyase [Chytriomyces sp. MP71]